MSLKLLLKLSNTATPQAAAHPQFLLEMLFLQELYFDTQKKGSFKPNFDTHKWLAT